MLAIKQNILSAKQLLNNNQKLCFVAKANCYGLGDKVVCKYVDNLVDCFAVSCEKEFFSINKCVTKPIIILNPIYKNITKISKFGGEFCVCNFESLNNLLMEAKKNLSINFKIHLAFNTGMNRLGFNSFAEVEGVINMCQKTQNVSIMGVFSHYYEANNKNYANLQFLKFAELKQKIEQMYPKNNYIFHLSNSDGVTNINGFDMVRVGYKIYEDSQYETIKLSSKIIDFQMLQVGDTAGYGAVFVASQKTKIAVIAIGYADGVMRNIYKKGYVLINDKFAKIVAICMDSMLVDVTGISCEIGDEVLLVGRDKTNQIFVCDVANWCDTIGYEIIAKLSLRIHRKYLR